MLHQDFDTFRQFAGDQVFKSLARDERNIVTNIRAGIELREYQEEAIGRFIYYLKDYAKSEKPTHLLFNMATGSGKTLIMAAAMLHLYSLGYRNFIFFTRLGHIVDKTKINFLQETASKYLFADRIVIDGKDVQIRQVNSFDGVNSDDISIMFSTTAGLHTQLNYPQENSINFESLESERLVLIADEAHNLSADTSKGATAEDRLLLESWESTVNRLHRSTHSNNVLLEFTATARLEEDYPEVIAKYKDKAIFKYDLKQYRLDGFSKDVSTFELDAPVMERALVAILISQYRMKIAEKNRIHLKPVVLFKANRVTSQAPGIRGGADDAIVVSSEFKLAFHTFISNLSGEFIDELKNIDDPTLKRAFEFFNQSGTSSDQLAEQLRIDFAINHCLTVDDKSDVDSKQQLLNTLEDPQNRIRAVFATEKLNEGWDVLNLFDIVRLYNSRDSANNRAGKTTVQEAQLIGRGARYYPFAVDGSADNSKRKFDDDSENELRILEELFYHSKTNPRYIQELRSVLTDSGIIADTSVTKVVSVKESFKLSRLWREGVIFLNSREKAVKLDVNSFADVDLKFDPNSELNVFNLPTRIATETRVFESSTKSAANATVAKTFSLSEMGRHVVRAAVESHRFGNLSSLQSMFGGLRSMEEFQTSDDFLGAVKVGVRGSAEQLNDLRQVDKFAIASHVIDRLLSQASVEISEYEGSREFAPKRISEVFSRDKHLKLDPSRDKERLTPVREIDLEAATWFAQNEIWGTSEEKALIVFIKDVLSDLAAKYKEISLFRNEQHFPIYSFRTGEAFYPDFVLFLNDLGGASEKVYQLFIEPKGDQFLDSKKTFSQSQEGWKQEFLEEIEERHRLVFESEKYRLIGLPFFNRGLTNPDLRVQFDDKFKGTVAIS